MFAQDAYERTDQVRILETLDLKVEEVDEDEEDLGNTLVVYIGI
jgi:hypothetical protein